MQMGACDTPGSADDPDLLPALHRVANGNRRLGQVKVARDDSAAVVDVHDIAREKEIVDECHDATIRGAHRIARLAGEVHTAVTAR
jgi:hypothetical protein